MSATLSKEDRHAIDLLLDRSATAAGNGNGKGNGHGGAVYAPTDGSMGPRVKRVEKLLRLLELLPDEQAPADLVGRTMRFIEQAAARPASVRTVPPLLNQQRPMA